MFKDKNNIDEDFREYKDKDVYIRIRLNFLNTIWLYIVKYVGRSQNYQLKI